MGGAFRVVSLSLLVVAPHRSAVQRMAISADTLSSMLSGLSTKSLRLSSVMIAQATAATGDDSKLRALQDSSRPAVMALASVVHEDSGTYCQPLHYLYYELVYLCLLTLLVMDCS
jgi:hypothetical protein